MFVHLQSYMFCFLVLKDKYSLSSVVPRTQVHASCQSSKVSFFRLLPFGVTAADHSTYLIWQGFLRWMSFLMQMMILVMILIPVSS